jgi:hypothetical protein
MPPVFCPHCRRPLALTKEMQGGPVRCPACSNLFKLGPGGAVPVAPPPPPPVVSAAPAPMAVPVAAPAARPPAGGPDELERFDVGEDPETKMHELRIEAVAKAAGDNLILAAAANVLAAFLLGLGALLATRDRAVVTALLLLLLLAWLAGVAVIVFGAVQLKNLRLRPFVVAAAYAAVGVGALGVLGSLVCVVLSLVVLAVGPTSSGGKEAAVVSYGFDAGPIVYLLVFGVLIAAAVFTVYAGLRTLQTLKDPELDAALR